ncbi:MAG: 2-oxoacid:acceptor oxidoreductase subunit alpha [Ardenticatenaceae bacterium]
MSVMTLEREAPVINQPEVLNDLSLVVATVNGTGSQTANLALIRALFQMGLPITGKNLFPSNIAGLPTWYTIRVSEAGYTARREKTDVLVAFNKNTYEKDIAKLPSGAVCVYSLDWRGFEESRDDLIYYGIPVKDFVKKSGAPFKLRDYVANMAYVGTLIEMLGIEYDEVKAALNRHFKGKQGPIKLNMSVVDMAREWVRENLTWEDPYRVERRNLTEGLMLIDGNTAGAIGSIMGGLSFAAWYPITPATSFADGLNTWMPRLRHNEDGQATYAIVQAEDELAALGMVAGAGWAGSRALTSTSGAGMSLMAEFAGMAYFAEIPTVLWNIQRMGPSTGLPTRVSQGDILSAYTLSHGDTKHVVLIPGNMQECYEFGKIALDLAEELQTLVIVLSDLDLGMNLWMTEPFDYPTEPLKRGKVLSAEDLANMTERWGRYSDVDGDGIGYRTLPGTPHPLAAYFTRGTGHDKWANYSEDPDAWQDNLARLARKHETARRMVPAPIVEDVEGSDVGFLSLGTNHPAIEEARDYLSKEGIEVGYLRLRGLPFHAEVEAFAERYERVYVIEMNADAQLCSLLKLDYEHLFHRFRPLNLCDGYPLTAKWIMNSLKEKEG